MAFVVIELVGQDVLGVHPAEDPHAAKSVALRCYTECHSVDDELEAISLAPSQPTLRLPSGRWEDPRARALAEARLSEPPGPLGGWLLPALSGDNDYRIQIADLGRSPVSGG